MQLSEMQRRGADRPVNTAGHIASDRYDPIDWYYCQFPPSPNSPPRRPHLKLQGFQPSSFNSAPDSCYFDLRYTAMITSNDQITRSVTTVFSLVTDIQLKSVCYSVYQMLFYSLKPVTFSNHQQPHQILFHPPNFINVFQSIR
jgi:hypothetical protein